MANRKNRRHRGRRGKAPQRYAPGSTTTVGLALMVRNEARNLPTLLGSIVGAFDHVALVDTGSTDDTVSLFREWCADTAQRHTVDAVEWNDDAASVRNHAQGLLDTEWVCWADGDDEIIGAHNVRAVAANAPAWLAGIEFDYDYIFRDGVCILSFPRERLVRRGLGTWTNRVHEIQVIDGPTLPAPRNAAVWKHSKTLADLAAGEARYVRELERWKAQEPDHPWVRVLEQTLVNTDDSA